MKNFFENLHFRNFALHKVETAELFFTIKHCSTALPRLSCKQNITHFEKYFEWYIQIRGGLGR